jgi:hypothetical protein
MQPADSPSFRKLAGIAIILLLILIWAVFVATLSRWISQLPILVQAIFYLFMGIVWILPLKPLLRWSQAGAVRGEGKAQD